MKGMLKQLKEMYEQTEIPEALDGKVDEAIRRARKKRRTVRISGWASSALAACLLLVVMVNVSPVLANAMYEIPVLGELCRMFTFQEYQQETDSFVADVRIPNVDTSSLPGDTSWAEEINETITRTIDQEVEASMERAQEYYKAYVETGGVPEEFMPVLIQVDYEVKNSTGDLLSFMIYKYETLASSYQQNYYYNIDLRTGKTLTLEDFLGEDWVEIVSSQVEEQLQQLPEDQKQMLFLDYVDLKEVVRDDIGFYINEDGNVVVVFPKYTIGAGALGLMEFEIIK